MGYPETLINKELEFPEINHEKNLEPPKTIATIKPSHMSKHTKKNEEPYNEITKNLNQIKNRDCIKDILDTTKIHKSKGNRNI